MDRFLAQVLPFCLFPAAMLYGDNQASLSIGSRIANIRKVRHLSLATLWIRIATRDGLVVLEYVHTKKNSSDLLTKILPREDLLRLLEVASIFEILR